MTSPQAPVLELFKLTKAYPSANGPAVIVKDFNLNFAAGEFITLIGHSGCGKSTVLSMVAGLTDITEGAMILAGRETNEAGPDRGVVFQSPCLLPWMTAFENVMLGVNQVYFNAPKTERRDLAEYYLSIIGLNHAMHKYPKELSQGMRQRVGILRSNRKCCCWTNPSACWILSRKWSCKRFFSLCGGVTNSPRSWSLMMSMKRFSYPTAS